MIAEFTARLKTFLDYEAAEAADANDGLGKLLEDATLLILATAPPMETTQWLPESCTALELLPPSEFPDDLLARLRFGAIASQAPAAGEKSVEELDGLISDLQALIEFFDNMGETRAAAIGQLVAGHLLLYARDPDGYRASFLEDAENQFAAADRQDGEALVRSFARLRTGETLLVALRTEKADKILESNENFADALDLLQSSTSPTHPLVLGSIRAQMIAGLGTSCYLLSCFGGESQDQLRKLAIDHLSTATAPMEGLPGGEERWAKAALTLARAWQDEAADWVAILTGAEAFAKAEETAEVILREIVDTAYQGAPEIWARANLLLAQLAGQNPGATRSSVVPHFEAALTIFGKRECPETWSKLQGQLGSFELNLGAINSDSAAVEEGLRHLQEACQIHDPIRDTERNAAQLWAEVLMQLERWHEAIQALEKAADAGEFVLARAFTVPAQRAESGVLSNIVKKQALVYMRTGEYQKALRRLVYATELDFAYGLLFPPTGEQMDELELLYRIMLGQTAIERNWHDYLPFARTEVELNGIRIKAGERLAPIVQKAMTERGRVVAARLAQFSLEAQVPVDGALVIPLFPAADSGFVVMLGGGERLPELVPAQYPRQQAMEAVFGSNLDDSWLGAYLHSLARREEAAGFADQPAVVESEDRILKVTFLPGQEQDPADMMPKETWIPALDRSASQTWSLLEPLFRHLDGKLPKGAPVIFMGEPLLAMLPLASAWRHSSGKVRYLAEDWSMGLVPAAGVLPSSDTQFQISPEDVALVVVDPTGSLPFAWWEFVALSAAQPNLAVRIIGGRRSKIKNAVLDAVADSTLHHFACHARYENSAPLDSCIDLGGGETLTAREIVSEMKLGKSKLVVLSACESAMINTAAANPERYVGLATAFLEAGAERVISTLWSVNDISTMLLMQKFYAELAQQPPIMALRNSQLYISELTAPGAVAMLRNVGQHPAATQKSAPVHQKKQILDRIIAYLAGLPEAAQPFEHPFYWSPFVHYGTSR